MSTARVRRWVDWASAAGVVVFLALCLCPATPFVFLLETPLWLLIGWARYLSRVAPTLGLNIADTRTALVCLVALVPGVYLVLRWLAGPEARVGWRGTLGAVGLIVLAFLAGIAAVGVSHQTAWLLTSPEPFLAGSLREAAARVTNSNNLKQLGYSLDGHERETGKLPGLVLSPEGEGLHGWPTLLLPYVEQDHLLRRLDLKKPWDHPDHAEPARTVVTTFLHPRVSPTDEEGRGLISYASNPAVLGPRPSSLKEVEQGTGLANTMVVADAGGNFRPWASPFHWRDPRLGLNRSSAGFGNPVGDERKSVTFLFGDGSVRSVSNDADPEVRQAMFGRAPGVKGWD